MRLKGKEGQRVTGKAVSLAAERRWPDEAAAGSDPSCVDAPATRSRSFLPRRRARVSSTLKLFASSSGRLPVHRVWGKKSPDRILHAQCICVRASHHPSLEHSRSSRNAPKYGGCWFNCRPHIRGRSIHRFGLALQQQLLQAKVTHRLCSS